MKFLKRIFGKKADVSSRRQKPRTKAKVKLPDGSVRVVPPMLFELLRANAPRLSDDQVIAHIQEQVNKDPEYLDGFEFLTKIVEGDFSSLD